MKPGDLHTWIDKMIPPDNRRRTCLKCTSIFISKGSENRICYDCRVINERWRINVGRRQPKQD